MFSGSGGDQGEPGFHVDRFRDGSGVKGLGGPLWREDEDGERQGVDDMGGGLMIAARRIVRREFRSLPKSECRRKG